jgi:hypothetical protein
MLVAAVASAALPLRTATPDPEPSTAAPGDIETAEEASS